MINHTYSKKGTYTVMSLVMNSDNLISSWATHSVTMPKTYSLFNRINNKYTFIGLLMGKLFD